MLWLCFNGICKVLARMIFYQRRSFEVEASKNKYSFQYSVETKPYGKADGFFLPNRQKNLSEKNIFFFQPNSSTALADATILTMAT
jgi:hypothetical protein